MKRVDLIRQLEQMGCVLIRHGGRHDWYQTRAPAPFSPRHRELKEHLARQGAARRKLV
jgi:hypothetical protein